MSGRLEELERLKAEVGALDQVFQTDTDYEHASYKVGRWRCLGVDVCGWDGDMCAAWCVPSHAPSNNPYTTKRSTTPTTNHTLKTNIKHK